MQVIKEPKRTKAIKVHICNYCGRKIMPREIYTKATFKEDYIYDWKSCDVCKPYVDEAFMNKYYDWSDGMGEEDFHRYMIEEHPEVAAEWWGTKS